MTALAAMATAAESPAADGRPRERDRLVVVGGRSHPAFVAEVCRYLEHPVGQVRLRTFSDGAIEVKLEENVRGRDVFIVQSGQANPNDHLIELLFLVDAARGPAPAASPPSCPTSPTARETKGRACGYRSGPGWWCTPWRWRGRGGC